MKKRNVAAGILALAGALLIVAAFATGLTNYPVFAGNLRGGFETREVVLEGPITDLEADLSMFSFELRAGDTDEAVLRYPVAMDPDLYTFTYEQNGSKLTLKDAWHGRSRFGINLGWGEMMGRNETKIELTLPAGTVLEQLRADLSMGSVLMEDLEAERTDVDIDMGSMTVNDSDLGVLHARLDMGSFNMRNLVLADGSETVLSMGSADGSLTLRGDLNIQASMGSVSLQLLDTRPISYDVQADMGSIEIGGLELRDSASQTEPDAVAKITARVNMGSIDIEY